MNTQLDDFPTCIHCKFHAAVVPYRRPCHFKEFFKHAEATSALDLVAQVPYRRLCHLKIFFKTNHAEATGALDLLVAVSAVVVIH